MAVLFLQLLLFFDYHIHIIVLYCIIDSKIVEFVMLSNLYMV